MIIFKIFWSENLKERGHLKEPETEYSTYLNLKQGGRVRWVYLTGRYWFDFVNVVMNNRVS